MGGITCTGTTHELGRPLRGCVVPVALSSDTRPDHDDGAVWVGPTDRVAIANSSDLIEFDQRVVAVAQRWAEASKVLFGLVSLIGAIGAALSVNVLSTGSRALVGVGMVVALTMAVGAVVLLQTAAGGSLKTITLAASLTERARTRRERADAALDRVKWGRKLAVSSVITVGATVGGMWLLTPKTAAILIIGTTDGDRYCAASLWQATTGAAFVIVTTSDRTVRLDPGDIDSIEPADRCP